MFAPSHLAELTQQRRLLAKQIQSAAKAQRRREQRLALQGGNTNLRLLVLLVFVASNSSVELATHCWCSRRRQQHCVGEEVTAERGRALVQEWIDTTTEAEWDALRTSTLSLAIRLREEARQFVLDAQTAVWASRCNKQKGHAPTSRQLRAARDQLEHQGTELAAAAVPAAPQKAASRWAHRWRSRWVFKYGKIQARERMEPLDMRAKDPATDDPQDKFKNLFWGPFWGP